MSERKKFAWLVGIFLVAYFVPFGHPKVSAAISEAFNLLQWYALHHTLGCVVPAMFIAGAIATFLNQASVMAYLGPNAGRVLAYGVASVAGVILAVCSCSVLPMFAGIYTMGAGLGPASAFLYSGPAINVMAIFLTARVLGIQLGLARAVGSIVFAVIIGLLMAFFFRSSERERLRTAPIAQAHSGQTQAGRRPLWKTALFFAAMILFLVFSDWYNTNDVTVTLADGTTVRANIRYDTRDRLDFQPYGPDGRLEPRVTAVPKSQVVSVVPRPGFVQSVHEIKWYLAGAMGLAVLLMVWRWFSRAEVRQWMRATWDFSLMIVPLLFGGVFVTGIVGAVIPESVVATLVGGNDIGATFLAAFVGMIWYFATLTEIPIVEMLTRLGMGQGPALSLLLAGPALSLPSILVIYRVIGLRKTATFCTLTVVMSTIVGFIFGKLVS